MWNRPGPAHSAQALEQGESQYWTLQEENGGCERLQERFVRALPIRRLGPKELPSWFRAAGSIPVNEPWSPDCYLATVKVERVEQQAKM